MDKQNAVYTDNMSFSLKNKEILSLAKMWVNCEDIMLNETSQSQKKSVQYEST